MYTDYDFTGKTAVITGAASGMGLLAAQNYAARGANVVMADINLEKAKGLAEEINMAGCGKALAVACDVRDYHQVEQVCAAAKETFGSIDIMINTAGGAETRMLKDQYDMAGLEFPDIPIEVYDWGMDVNLKGQFYFDHVCCRYMREQKSGVIVNIGSITGQEGCNKNIAYSTSKSAAMNGLTKSVALYGGPYNIRCVCIAPGPVLTRPGMAGMKTLLGRAAEPQEMVDLMLFLTSTKAAFITGVNILADGGRDVLRVKQ